LAVCGDVGRLSRRALEVEHLNKSRFGPAGAQHAEADDRAHVRERLNQHALREVVLAILQFQQGRSIKPAAAGVWVIEEAETESLERVRAAPGSHKLPLQKRFNMTGEQLAHRQAP
jgi:hypothetical protein